MAGIREKSPVDLETKGEVFRETPMSSTTDLFEDGSVDPVYQAKTRVLNAAMQEIGMGKYEVRSLQLLRDQWTSPTRNLVSQWSLFAIAGFGWFAYVVILDVSARVMLTIRPYYQRQCMAGQ